MLYIFVLGGILLVATCYLLVRFVDDMTNHKYNGNDKLSVLYMVSVIVFIIFALIAIYNYCEGNASIAQGIDDEVKHLLG